MFVGVKNSDLKLKFRIEFSLTVNRHLNFFETFSSNIKRIQHNKL